MSWTKWLKYSTYEFGQVHTKELVMQDVKFMGRVFIIIAVIMSAILGIVIFVPETRYDSGMDNLPKLLLTITSAVVGFILTVIPIKTRRLCLSKGGSCARTSACFSGSWRGSSSCTRTLKPTVFTFTSSTAPWSLL